VPRSRDLAIDSLHCEGPGAFVPKIHTPPGESGRTDKGWSKVEWSCGGLSAMAREGIEPPTRGFSGRQDPVLENHREPLGLVYQRVTMPNPAIQDHPDTHTSTEFRYDSGTGTHKDKRGRPYLADPMITATIPASAPGCQA
jgi:hypothetical protein